MYVYMLAALQSNYFVTERWQRIRNASSNALGALREARNNSIAAEQRHNFGKRRCSTSRHKQTKRFKTNNSWTHKFYCLSGTDQDRVPSSTLEKNALVLADLGEKKVTIPDVDCDIAEFNEALLQAFPKLQYGGGFEILKCTSSTRKLEIIPFTISRSVRLLRGYIGTARLYIRPIQVDLDLTPTEGIDDHMVRMININIKLHHSCRLMLNKNVCSVERVYQLLN